MDKDQALETLDRFKGCVNNDHCEATDCAYYVQLRELEELIAFLDEVLPDE